MLVLRTLADGPAHGYAIARRIEEASGDALRLHEGSLYPALHRLENRHWIGAEWAKSETNRRARIYRLVGEGRKQLRREVGSWSIFCTATSKLGISRAGTLLLLALAGGGSHPGNRYPTRTAWSP